ncbi:hypothetical protein psyc5s11_39160 [Clostridium gelidum]|uniref:DUF4179 domain-containing protein n=1 Tax=Clostridium gelidum TaxID=704125 RepID=A0ABM7T9Q7_9CLOT|nr:DUF4179 domain-containing protein [Clostridium gelidum]BCZ47849.1 hypothetical protein psyc5s11_39160 [Clostridium gelidum]
MVNKKLSRSLGPILGIMGFMLGVGVLELPVLADDNVQANYAYSNSTTSAAVTYKDYGININKSATQNGFKVTVEKATATKHKLKVTLKIESEKSFEKMKRNNSIFEVTYGKGDSHSHTNSRSEYINDKTMIVTLEKDNYEGEYPENGEMRVDVVLSNYKVNIGIDIPVDFTESFNNIIEKDISGKIPEFDYTLNKLESDIMGTRITYSKPKRDENTEDKSDTLFNSAMVLKVGDKMYKTGSNGSYSGEDGVSIGNYESKLATYDKVKDENNISIIPVICNISVDELDKIYKQDINKEKNISKETTNNVSYEKNFNFTDGSKGEIYKIERNDNSIKVYCKGESEKESLLMVSNIDMNYQYIKGNKDNVFYDNDNVSFYKDQKESLGYIVEFDNVEKDKIVELSFNTIIKNADKYKLENEIKLSN